MKILDRTSLDKQGCSIPNCTHDHSILYLHQTCHDVGLAVIYEKENGQLHVSCELCGSHVATIQVAK